MVCHFGGVSAESTDLYKRAKITSATPHSAFIEQQARSTDCKAMKKPSVMVNGSMNVPVIRKLERDASGGIGIRQGTGPRAGLPPEIWML